MIGAVVEDDPEIDYGKSGEITAAGGVFDSLFYRGDEVLGDGAAEDVVDEFKFSATGQRLHLYFAIAVLAVAAGLLLVAPLDVGFAADGFAIGNLGSFEVDLSVVALFEFGNYDFDVLLTGSGDEEFFGLRVAEETQHGVFFHEFVKAGA